VILVLVGDWVFLVVSDTLGTVETGSITIFTNDKGQRAVVAGIVRKALTISIDADTFDAVTSCLTAGGGGNGR
jgi:hypothetical protein